jgi:hypothetical protein
MKMNTLKQYAKLRAALEQEQATLLIRLNQLNAALGGSVPSQTKAAAPAKGKGKGKGKRKMSAAGRAAIAAAAKARWAKVRAAKSKAVK